MYSLGALFFLPVALAAPNWPQGNPGWHPGNGPWGPRPGYSTAKAAYFLENDPAGSSIVSLKIDGDMVSDPMRTATGGKGSIFIEATSDTPAMADSLGSQGCVTVSGNMLFTVNAGSSTLSMFLISPEDPYHPQLVGSPIATGGDFPMSVTYSEQLRTACVLNTGARSGVSCFSVDPQNGLRANGPLRSVGSAITQTTPPMGPPGTGGQILFNPESTAVIATVKGNANMGPGYILAWPITYGRISTDSPVSFRTANLQQDFGFSFLSPNRFLLSDTSFGGAIIEVSDDLSFSQIAHTVIAEQKAACWSQFDPSLNTAYVIDAGSNNVYKINPSSGANEGTIVVNSAGGGVFDSAIFNNHLISLNAANGVSVVDLQAEKETQFLNLTSFGNRQFYQGMAVWP